jgi:hypothetical protein
MTKVQAVHLARTARQGILVGIAGGLIEIAWIALYGAATGRNTTAVARAISTTIAWILPGSPPIAGSIGFGIAFHMIAAVGLGVALTFVWRALTKRELAVVNEYTFMAGALTIVWAFNFFIVLPQISPALPDVHRAFVEIVPYLASLISKLLFGLAGAAIIRYGADDRTAWLANHVRSFPVGRAAS